MRMRLTSDLPVPVDPRTTSSGSTGLRAAIVATLRRRSGPKRRSIHVCVAGGCSTHCRPGVVGSDERRLAAAVLSSKIEAACLLAAPQNQTAAAEASVPHSGAPAPIQNSMEPQAPAQLPVPCLPPGHVPPPNNFGLDTSHNSGARRHHSRSQIANLLLLLLLSLLNPPRRPRSPPPLPIARAPHGSVLLPPFPPGELTSIPSLIAGFCPSSRQDEFP